MSKKLGVFVVGVGVGVLQLACVSHLSAEPLPDSSAAREESKYLSDIRQVTDTSMGFTRAGEAYFSPDGQTVIFQAFPPGSLEYQIYVMNLQERKPRMVSTGKGGCTCAFFRPDGKKIIFASSHLRPDDARPPEKTGGYKWFFDEHMDIFEADPDGNSLRRLTDAFGYDAECTYSPDGKRIVFTSMRDGDQELYVMDADGRNQKRLTFGAGYDGGPFFSPNGSVILYRGDRRSDGKQDLQIRLIDSDGKNDRAVTDNQLFNWCPYWHPSGKSFIFTQADHGVSSKSGPPKYDLYWMPIDGSKAVRITYDPGFDGLPVFSPDGKRLIWSSKRGGLEDAQLFIADFKMPVE